MPPIITIKKVFKNDQNLAIVLNNIYLLEHYEVLSYHFWPAYRQNRLSVFVPEDRCIPLGEI